jgi:steroid 5-alpha reductase family enzyme
LYSFFFSLQAKHKEEHGKESVPMDGLFSRVQYPNYTGELLFWAGLGLYWSAELRGPLRLAAVVPAAFAGLILTRASGIPLSEKSRDKRSQSPALVAYRRRTAWLIPGIY